MNWRNGSVKRVLFVINTLGRAGAEIALLEMLRRLDTEQIEIDLYVLTGQGELGKELPDHVRLLNRDYSECSVLSAEGRRKLVRTTCLALFGRGRILRLFPYLCGNFIQMIMAGKLQKEKLLWRALADAGERFAQEYDLAVAYLEGGAAYYVTDHVKARKKAAFVHVDYLQAGYSRKLDRDCYLRFDRIFAVSGEVKDVFLTVYPECAGRTEIFPVLTDRERILRMSREEGGFRESQVKDITENGREIRILSVGRLTAQKAYEISIEAMQLLKMQGQRARWYVLGEGEERTKLERRIRELGLEDDFILLGAAENPYPYMRQADIFVQASRFEGKSVAVMEAAILGKPILLSDRSGNREQIKNGVDGLLCELTPQAVCSALCRLIQDAALRERLGHAAMAAGNQKKEELSKFYELL